MFYSIIKLITKGILHSVYCGKLDYNPKNNEKYSIVLNNENSIYDKIAISEYKELIDKKSKLDDEINSYHEEESKYMKPYEKNNIFRWFKNKFSNIKDKFIKKFMSFEDEIPEYIKREKEESELVGEQMKKYEKIRPDLFDKKEQYEELDANGQAWQDYIDENVEPNSKRKSFKDKITEMGKLQSKEQQKKGFEAAREWAEQNKQEIEQDEIEK